MIEVKFSSQLPASSKNYIFFVDQNLALPDRLSQIDLQSSGFVSKVLHSSQNFKGKFGQIKVIPTLLSSQEIVSIILVGTGEAGDLNDIKVENLGGKIYQVATSLKTDEISIVPLNDEHANSLVFGFLLASYSFDKYKTKVEEPTKHVKECNVFVIDEQSSKAKFEHVKNMQQAIFLTRDLVNEVPNVLNTDAYADLIIKHLTGLNVEVQVLGELEMQKLGMNALLGVGQGSSSESKLVVMKYNGSGSDDAPVALVGKGVVFDSGGISLKPSTNMHEMKYDMAGSASVFGTIRALAANKSKANVVGVVALVENMPDGNAQRPGDIVKTMSGQTAEVLDTDAEGRLILADALWYTQLNFKPKLIIDLATLTGAIVVALGNTFAGCFSNNDELAQQLIAAGNKVNEKLWRMPMHEEYDKMIKSEVADWANIGTGRGTAGSAMGAHFLEKFVNNFPWAHLDIAGLAWEKGVKDIYPKGATGYGVRLLTQFIKDNYEQK
jgi:leucyl aminopeptidase